MTTNGRAAGQAVREARTLHRPSGRTGYGLALAATTVSLWSILPIGLKIALTALDAMTLTWVRFVVATVVLTSVLRSRGSMPPVGKLMRHDWWLLAVAAFGLAGNYGFYSLGLHYTNAGTAQVVIQIAPMLFTLGGLFVFGESFSATQWTGLGVLVAGMALFSREQIASMTAGLDRYYAGLAFIVAGAVTWAAYGLAQKQPLQRLGAPQIMVLLYAAGALLFLPLATPRLLFSMNGVQSAALVFCCANMVLSYASFSEALAHVEASRLSALLASVPLGTLAAVHAASLLAPSLFAPEAVTVTGIIGAALVVCGSLMSSLAKS